MSAPKQSTPSPVAAPSLEWLIAPIGKAQFFESYWEKQPLVIHRGDPAYYRFLLSLEEVDRALATLGRRYPDIILKNASRSVTADDYTLDGETLDVGAVCRLFEEGSTITLAYLDTVLPALTLFCRALENEFNCPSQTNIYLTPPAAQGAKPHYDTHDVFVLQIAGSKQWTIYGTPLELPLPGQDFDAEIHPRGAATLAFELQAGDMAYVPRGVVHDARSTDAVSLHVTAGILRFTWLDLLLEFVAGAGLNDPAFRKALPAGFARPEFDRAAARRTLRDLLERAWAKSDFDAALDRFADEFLSSCPPVLEGQLAQMASLERLRIDGVAGTRPGAIALIRENADSLIVECYRRKISFPAYSSPAVRRALSGDEFVVRDLPGDLDDAGKLTLVRRLIREGLVVARLG
ncbi:MAG TPA: cupin domain-containing protein [Candidatus Acidoferrales bacterium]|nr:cupin domain-containing protein [Candidatus Acidoferrales bacterium]